MIFARYRVLPRTRRMVVELLNTPKCKRGYTSANATYHLENALIKHVDEVDRVDIKVVDQNNPYLRSTAGMFGQFAKGLVGNVLVV